MGMDCTPTPQHFALLALVYMMSYLFVFDKVRWQLRHSHPRIVPTGLRSIDWGLGATGSPFRK